MIKTYKTLYTGPFQFAIETKDGRRERIKFVNQTYQTSDEGIQEVLDEKVEVQKDIPAKKRTIMDEVEFFKVVSPEKLYVSYNGMRLHITQVKELIDYAIEHGAVVDEREIITNTFQKRTIRKGSQMAGNETNSGTGEVNINLPNTPKDEDLNSLKGELLGDEAENVESPDLQENLNEDEDEE